MIRDPKFVYYPFKSFTTDENVLKKVIDENELLKKELDEIQSKKNEEMADSFKKLKDEFKSEEIKWLWGIIITSFPFVILIILFYFDTIDWRKSLVLDTTLLPILLFSIRQYSKVKILRIENANKETINRGFKAYINESPENSEDKRIFLQHVSNVLFSKVTETKDKNSNIPFERFLEILSKKS